MAQKIIRGIVVSTLFALFWSCSTSKLPKETVTQKERAVAAAAAGDYSQAVQMWISWFENQDSRNQDIEFSDYALAASDAYRAENNQLAVQWYDKARLAGYKGADMYVAFIHIFRKQNNLSREMTALQALSDGYPEESSQLNVNGRLFEIYMETDRTKAYQQWASLPVEYKVKESSLSNFFILTKQFEEEALSDSVATELLKVNGTHIPALEWMAGKYYHKAENQYQREMDKYNKNRTHVQYTFLLNELKKISEDFRKSRDFFEKLWAQDKNSRYAAFLANIYTRLDNPDRAAYYRKLSASE